MTAINERAGLVQATSELLDPGNGSFPDVAAQEQLYGCTRDVAEYCAKGAVSSVVLLDRSIRPAATALTTYWDAAETPWSDRPNLQFFTPDSRWHPVHNAPLRSALFAPVRALVSLTARQVSAQLEKVNSLLLDQKDEPVLLFDACLHTGKRLLVLNGCSRSWVFKMYIWGFVQRTRQRAENWKLTLYISLPIQGNLLF